MLVSMLMWELAESVEDQVGWLGGLGGYRSRGLVIVIVKIVQVPRIPIPSTPRHRRYRFHLSIIGRSVSYLTFQQIQTVKK